MTPAHQVPGEPSGKEQPATEGAGEGWDEEQSKSANRVCGDPATWWVATEIFKRVLFRIPPCSHMVQEATEVNLTREEEHRGRRSAAKGDHSTTKTRSRSSRGRSVNGGHLQQIKTARARTREPLKKTARERTQAPFHQEEPPGALCDDEGMLMVKHTPKRRNAGERHGEMKEKRRKGNEEKWRKKKQQRKDREKRRRELV